MTIATNALEDNIEMMMNTKSIEGFKPYLMTDFDSCGKDDKICTLELGDIKLEINVYVRHGEGCTVAWKMYKNDQLSEKGDKHLNADYYDEKDAYQYAKGLFYYLIRLWIEETQKEEELIIEQSTTTTGVIMTIAQTIANLFDNDGQLWENDQGLDLYELCEEAGYSEQNVATFNEATEQHGSFTEVFFFPDNSYLAISGGAWDISDDQGLTGWGCKIV